jgi:[citrate (pro-3S)-lyase] ligase
VIGEELRLYDDYRSFKQGELVWSVVSLDDDKAVRDEIEQFLRSCDLGLDIDATDFVIVRSGGRLVACAGMGENIVKCVAVSPSLRGESITSRLITEVTNIAADVGMYHLFLYTRPQNVETFEGCGFYKLVEMPGTVALMENTPSGLSRYCESLRLERRPGSRIGCIVMNANPFTYGHQYLAERAAEDCDWLHVFVVSENASLVTYEDRYALVREGLKHLPRTTVHPGSAYMVSKATFPGYFLKNRGIVDQCHTAIDLLIFREYVAPALGISHRYVGTEPFCAVTAKYNADMKYWLTESASKAPPVSVVEIERRVEDGIAISASEVRRLLRADDFERMAALAPPATVALLRAKYFDPGARVATGTG